MRRRDKAEARERGVAARACECSTRAVLVERDSWSMVVLRKFDARKVFFSICSEWAVCLLESTSPCASCSPKFIESKAQVVGGSQTCQTLR